MATIFALSSGALPAAIAVFRLSGSRSLPALQEISHRQKWEPRELRYTKLYLKNNEVLDTAMAVHLPGPSTFTGEDSSEIYVHGSPAVANALADRLIGIEGVRQAKRGEFSKRAFFNGKMDVSEVHGLKMLIQSETDRQRRVSYRQMRGGDAVRQIRENLTNIAMRVYVLMDFGEHVDTSVAEIHKMIKDIIPEVASLVSRSRSAFRVQRGLNFVLIGRPNTGKSSIMNALAEEDIAIVSPLAGTTRDSLQTRIQIKGIPVSLTDTAGLRETGDPLEMEGIHRARAKLKDADLIMLVVVSENAAQEASEILNEIKEYQSHESIPVIIVRNKSDLKHEKKAISLPNITKVVDTCALSRNGLMPLIEALESEITRMCPDENGPALTDHNLIEEVLEILIEAQNCHDAALLCVRLEECLSHIGQLTGDTVNEEILEKLFETFCIGK